jgi:hypothetical protein
MHCRYIFAFSGWYADYNFLDDPAAADDISLSATARTIAAAIAVS